MARPSSATPLLALDAVVIDTETTALDPRKASIVEVGAVRLAAGRIVLHSAFRRLIRPAVSIPASATKVHGIDDAAVTNAQTLAQAWPELAGFLADSVLIGHTIGFDLAVIKRECTQAGIAWTPPRTLDTRLLAQVAEPGLAAYSLESLAAWLDIELADRHSALGDADLRAHLRRPPARLRDANIRTLAEAERACRALTDVLDAHHRAGWAEPVAAPAGSDAESALQRIDSYPYRHRIRDVMRSPPCFITAGQSVRDTLGRMMDERISSLYVRPPLADAARVAARDAGIVTERDLLRALAEHGGDALALPADRFMSRPLAAVPEDAFVYRAIGLMSERKIRHLGVVDESGCLVGALSARDLLRLRAGEALALGAAIADADDSQALAPAWAKLPPAAAALLREDLAARAICPVISRELGALTRQAAVIAERRMHEQGHGGPPCPYAVAVLGSGGRDESCWRWTRTTPCSSPKANRRQRRSMVRHPRHADERHSARRGVPYCRVA